MLGGIELRMKAQREYDKTIAEWQTRTLAQFIAATVRVKKGTRNPLADAADKVALTFDSESSGADQQSMEDWIEHGSAVAAERNRPGSFERLTRGLRQ